MKTTIAQIHRFRDNVAVYVADGKTIYLDPATARRLAQALTTCAADVEDRSFTKSKFPTTEIKLP